MPSPEDQSGIVNHPGFSGDFGLPDASMVSRSSVRRRRTQRRQVRRPHPPHGARGIRLLAEGDRTHLSARNARLVDSSTAGIALAAKRELRLDTPTSRSLAVVAPHRCVAEHTDTRISVDNLKVVKVQILGRLSRHFSQPLNTFSTAAAQSREDCFLTTTLPRG